MPTENNPAVIYLGPACEAETGDGRTWAEDWPWPDCECGHQPVQYVLGETFNRVKAEREALQADLDAKDQRVDELEQQLRALLAAPAEHIHEWDINAEGTTTVCYCGARSSDEPAAQSVPPAVGEPEVVGYGGINALGGFMHNGGYLMVANKPERYLDVPLTRLEHVTRLQAEVEKFKATNAELSASNVRRRDREVAARKELDALKAAQGEPVAWFVQWNSILLGITGHREVVLVQPFFSPGAATVTPLYASPPAPVAVVLPERMEIPDVHCPERINAQGWNACLDEVARLNSL